MRFWRQALAALCFLHPAPVLAWGAEGHETIAYLAAMNLTPNARAQVAALLGGEAGAAMAIAADWADEIRDDRPETSPWHYVNLEIDGDHRYLPARDCPNDACVVAQIDRQAAALSSGAPRERKVEALKFLIHFVGDIHQPLHAADNHDRGGNMVRVTLQRGRPETLHHVWDDDIVAVQGRDPARLARQINDGPIGKRKAVLMTPQAPAAWALESASLARTVVYPQFQHGIDKSTVAGDAPIAREQLARAGYGLAGLLNRIFR